MSFRDMIVQLDESPQASARAQVASALAARHKAHLTGVFLASDFLRTYFAAEAFATLPPIQIETLLREHAAAVERAAEAARASFEAATGEDGVASEWRIVNGDWDTELVSCARRTDLTVLPSQTSARLGRHRIAAAQVALACGGPVLITRDEAFPPNAGRRVLVAWKNTREAARALHDAWPIIELADEVHVLMVSPNGDEGADSLLQRQFERRGCRANLIVDRRADSVASWVVREHVEALRADILVMGLYGRPRLEELILGGVSREILSDPPTTLFVAH